MGLDNPTLVLQRFRRGRQCYIARVRGKIADYCCISFDEENIGELGLSMHLLEGEAYIWDCATLPAHCGQHLYPVLRACILDELKSAGIRRI
jgi:hypothetical protein